MAGRRRAEAFNINQSFLLVFIVIIGGLGTLIGSFFGAALIHILPIVIRAVPDALGVPVGAATVEHLTFLLLGAMILFFLVVEPHGLAQLWKIAKQKLRLWPFPTETDARSCRSTRSDGRQGRAI